MGKEQMKVTILHYGRPTSLFHEAYARLLCSDLHLWT